MKQQAGILALLGNGCIHKGFKIKLIMPETASIERIKTMKAYGAEVILVTKEQDMEGARDLQRNAKNGKVLLNQFANKSNYLAHYDTTGLKSGIKLTKNYTLCICHGYDWNYHWSFVI